MLQLATVSVLDWRRAWVGVGVGVPPPPWPGAWISTVIGEPVLKNPTVALAVCGG